MVHPVTINSVLSGFIVAYGLLVGAKLVGFDDLWQQLTFESKPIRFGVVAGSLIVAAWFFPWVTNQVFGLHGCYFTQLPHVSAGGLFYGLVFGLGYTGIAGISGVISRRDYRTLVVFIGFYSLFGVLLGLIHGLTYPQTASFSLPSCPPLL